MAQLIPYNRKKGTTYGVKWRLGGGRDGEVQHETFDDEKDANFFKADVERHDHQYPPNYVPHFGYVDPAVLAEERARLKAEAEKAAVQPVLFRDRYLDFLPTLTGIEERTRQDYRQQFRNHLLPAFGNLVVNDAADAPEEQFWEADKVKRWVNRAHLGVRDPQDPERWELKPSSAKTVRNLHALLSSYGTWLVVKKLRASNPCVGTRLPESEEGDADSEMVFLEKWEFAMFCDSVGDDAKDLVEFLAGTGLRYGEATAMKIKDLNIKETMEEPHLLVRRAWKRQPNGSHKLGKPKSKSSRRRVELAKNEAVLNLLRRITYGREPDEFVFLTPTGVPWRHNNFYNRAWVQAVWKAVRCPTHRAKDDIRNMHDLKMRHAVPCGCPGTLAKTPRIHDLRHSNAAWLIEAGVSLFAIGRQFGHASYNTTQKRYGHLTRGAKEAMGAASSAALPSGATFAAPVGDSVGGTAALLVSRQRETDRRMRRHRMLASGVAAGSRSLRRG